MGLSVSVVVAAFDAERFVAEAVGSVRHEGVAEVVVVDDGSTDGTAAAAEGAGARVVRLDRNQGCPAALNAGIAAATGDLLSFCDADDLWVPGSLAARLAALTDDVDVVMGRTQNVLHPDLADEVAARVAAPGAPFLAPVAAALLVRRAWWDHVGPLEAYATSALIDWWSRSEAAGARVATIDDVVLHRRIHGENLGFRQRAERAAELPSVLRAHLARRRGRAG